MTPFSWSLSRHQTFATCRRRYYSSYYAAQTDPEIRRLKALSALPLWAGSLVHDAIERWLKSATPDLSSTATEAFIRDTVHGPMASQFRESAAGPLGFRLIEHEYELPLEQEDKRIAVATVRGALRRFFSSATLSEALETGRERWVTIEDLVSYHIDDVEILLRMDFAFRAADGRLVIVDWKTGRSEGRYNSIQVAGYALYASERNWAKVPGEIETRLEYLSLERTARREVTDAGLAEARVFVQRSAREMRSLLRDPLVNQAWEEDFARADQPQVCRRCNFRRLCFPRPDSTL